VANQKNEKNNNRTKKKKEIKKKKEKRNRYDWTFCVTVWGCIMSLWLSGRISFTKLP
jgi:hypothetical protein